MFQYFFRFSENLGSHDKCGERHLSEDKKIMVRREKNDEKQCSANYNGINESKVFYSYLF